MIFVTPTIDMLIFLVTFYALLYVLYGMVYKKDIIGLYRVDVKVTVILFVLAYLVYGQAGVVDTLFGYEIAWFWIFIVLSTMIETVFFFVYKKKFNITIPTIPHSS